MGTNESKLAEKLPQDEKNEETGSIPSTPILTPKIVKNCQKSGLDPRSPSKNISRTPIHLISAVCQKLEELNLNENPQTPIHTKILDIDPRSPAIEFQRTPIVVSASPDKVLPDKIRNKNLDKVRGLTFPTPKSSPLLTKFPKLLESSAVTPRKSTLNITKRKSLVLLETNIDFTETDLDAVIKEKYSAKNGDTSDSKENLSLCDVEDPRSPNIDVLRTPIQVPKIKGESCTSAACIDTVEEEENNGVVEQLEEEPQEKEYQVNEEKLEPEEMLHKSVFGVKFEDSVSFICLSPMSKKLLETSSVVPKLETNILESKLKHVETIEETKECKVQDEETINVVTEKHIETNTLTKQAEPEIRLELLDLNTAQEFSNILLKGTLIGEKFQKKTSTVTAEHILDICEEVIKSSPEQKKSKLVLSPIPKVNSDLFVRSTLLSLNSKAITPKKCESEPITPPLIDLTADVKELDKKLTNLIYEDEDLVVCPRIVKIKEQSRTPLGLRNSSDNVSNQRPPQKLKVSDKPRQSEYAVSKIPVFREKNVKKSHKQCENTPPRNMGKRSDVKCKKSKWDTKDNTLVI